MARVTHVKKAQQRYKTVPVIDPETGQQKVVPVKRKDGTAKTTKKGREIVRRLTQEDKSQPLPNRKCERCGKEIEVGQPYKWVAPKSGPYGGHKRYRCGECPTWKHWELSSNKRAPIWQAQDEANIHTLESVEDIESAVQSVAETIREVAQEYENSADNMEDGFGHSTYQSEDLREQSDALNSWADELESWTWDGEDAPDTCEKHTENIIFIGEQPDEDCECQEFFDAWLEAIQEAADTAISEEP